MRSVVAYVLPSALLVHGTTSNQFAGHLLDSVKQLLDNTNCSKFKQPRIIRMCRSVTPEVSTWKVYK